MTDFHSGECVTHHQACDCREAHFRKLEEALRWIQERAGMSAKCSVTLSMIEDCAAGVLHSEEGERVG